MFNLPNLEFNIIKSLTYLPLKLSILILFLLLLNCKILINKEININNFPTQFVGDWSGKLLIFNHQKHDTIDMKLVISPKSDTSFVWKIIYGTDTINGKRNYELISKKNNQFVIDELNGIQLNATLIHNKLISRFSVMNNLLECIYTFNDREIKFEVMSGKEKPINTTGDTIFNMDTIPIVRNFAISNYQIAYLHKLKLN